MIVAVLLGACSGVGAPAGVTDSTAQTRYDSADGSVTTWPEPERGEPVVLQGQDYEGNPVATADWAGDVVVVNTWYAACPPCRAEAPDLAAAANDYAGRGVRFVGVNATDEAGTAQAFEETFGVPYPTIDDAGGSAVAALQGQVPVQAVPTTLVLDREGRAAARILGLADASTLRGLIDGVLAEAP